ncbi:tyrosine-type recombinase/integrase [Planosporangium mesophilum]|uniref:Integrase n=1 Tax=Planosporangium mesophilum TaxID=689768 RepID=A0A8J3TJU1_9ACTN|nr:site-specific integrase [Planosporangium mesophilum]NJC86794.1 site-specific integrase [Planosporangium mesophilum]GII26502.1 integrase [Planosporangium mesophilum]
MTRRRAADRPAGAGLQFSHSVRIWDLRVNEGKKRRTYSVRWIVGGEEQHRTFASRALADAFRAKLLSYVQRGAQFDKVTGLPEPMLRESLHRPWYEHACRYVDMKWPSAAPKSRTGIAESLAAVTPALLSGDRGRPAPEDIREALYGWAFVAPRRQSGAPPRHLAGTVRWLERNTVSLGDLEDRTRGPELVRRALDVLALRLDGKPAAAKTVARKRAIFYNALEYAVELGLLTTNPIDRITWRAPAAVESVDRRVVVDRRRARTLLTAVAVQPGVARRLVAMFGCMYYAALRPSEALDLRRDNIVSLPEHGWGELLLSNSSPRTGTAWTDSGRSREQRGLKHRAREETRPVPAHPELVELLRYHLDHFGTAPDGRLFVGPRGGTIGDSTYAEVWRKARELALTPAEVRSPLAGVPYDLRHAAVSTWLNAGVPATQVAEWAGHSVAVLLRVYAKCIVGQDEAARRRIEDAMQAD